MIMDRKGNVLQDDTVQDKTLTFLYNNFFGRILLKLLCRRFISNLGRMYMNSRFSKKRINKLIKSENIDMTQYEQRSFSSFNDFFTRKILEGKRSIDNSPEALISPADSKLTVYDISEDSVYSIKGCDYSTKQLLMDKDLAKEFAGGKCLIYRLTVDNYHRYCHIDNGTELSRRFIKGILHTVNPIALVKHDVYGKNCRELTLFQTENFGRVAYIEIGAMMVGRINNYPAADKVQKGEEKGYFSFGGSTIAVLYKKDTVIIDKDISENSKKDIETTVLYGERVGTKKI